MVESGCDISHQAHEEKRHLQDLVAQEVQAFHKLIIPRYSVEIDQE